MPNTNTDHFPDWDETVAAFRSNRGPDGLSAFDARMRGALFISPGTLSIKETDTSSLDGRKRLSVYNGRAVMKLDGGQRLLMLFTSESEFKKTPLAKQGYAVMDFKGVCTAVAANKNLTGAIINPTNLKSGVALTLSDLQRIKDGAGDAASAEEQPRKPGAELFSSDGLTPEQESAVAGVIEANPQLADILKSYADGGGQTRLNRAETFATDSVMEIKVPVPKGATPNRGGSASAKIDLRKANVEFAFALATPPGLGQAIADALLDKVRSVYYMLAKIHGGKYGPFIAADFDGPAESVCNAIAGAARGIMGEHAAELIVAKASGKNLLRAQTIGELLYSRDDGYISP
jgi:hypothetical protein